MRAAQNKKHSQAKTEEQKKKNEALIVKAHQEYLDVACHSLIKIRDTIATLKQRGNTRKPDMLKKLEIEGFMQHAIRQIDQTKRRVILGENIPHAEKVFSIFEPHTEWISKGKAGVPVELGVKVCILEDQHQFILRHQVMEKKTDDQVAVSMVADAKMRFQNLNACSIAKGFHTPENQIALREQLEQGVLPKKASYRNRPRLAAQTEAFLKARHAHSAVESAINALEVHGLDMCPDHGIDGFKRYVALAVVARNIHRIGDILWKQEKLREQRKFRYSERSPPCKRAA